MRAAAPPALAMVLALVLASGCSDDDPAAGVPDGGGSADGSARFKLTVAHGAGSGTYAAGQTVHVWSTHDPRAAVLTAWSGDAALLAGAGEWHTTLTMPARAVTLEAATQQVSVTLTRVKVQGVKYQKPVRYHVPPSPKGLIFFFHGTGGSGAFIEKTASFHLALSAIRRGFGVVATDAEEVQAGDLDGNGKIRWLSSVLDPQKNTDMRNVQLIRAWLVAQKAISDKTPTFALGMSNGGAFSVSIGAALGFTAAASYCADGINAVADRTKTPTMWAMCGKDTNTQVSNADAKKSSQALAQRGVATLYLEHPPSPLYDERFARVQGVDAATSSKVAAELRAAAVVDRQGFFVKSAADIQALVQKSPSAFPTLSGLKGAQKLSLSSELKAMMADHQFYDDFADATLDWFEARAGK